MTIKNKIRDLSNLQPILVAPASQKQSTVSQATKAITALQEKPLDPKVAESRITSLAATVLTALAECTYFMSEGISTCSTAKFENITDTLTYNCVQAFENSALYSLPFNNSLIVCKNLKGPLSTNFFETALDVAMCQTNLEDVFEPLSFELQAITCVKFMEDISIVSAGYFLPDRLLRKAGLEGSVTKDMLRTLISCGSSTACGYLSGLGIAYPLFTAGCTKITEWVIDLFK